jgi:zinc and cadmium transporter
MLGGGATRRRAHLVNLAFSLMVPLGAVLFLFFRGALAGGIESPFTGSALAFSAGTFLCVALSDLLPELQFHEHDRFKLSAALMVGIVLMYLAARVHR